MSEQHYRELLDDRVKDVSRLEREKKRYRMALLRIVQAEAATADRLREMASVALED